MTISKDDSALRPLKERVLVMDGLGAILVPAGIGICLCAFGFYAIFQGLGALKDDTITGIGATFLCIGIVVISWEIWKIFFLFLVHFGRWNGFVTQGQLHAGDVFKFRFEQYCRLDVAVESIGIFLIFRETITSGDTWNQTTKSIDRLVQDFSYQGRVFNAGEIIVEECVFQIPEQPMGIRNEFMEEPTVEVSTAWVVKVRLIMAEKKREDELTDLLSQSHLIPARKKVLVLGFDDDFWREFKIEVEDAAGVIPVDESTNQQDDLFDIYLCKHGYYTFSERDQAISKFVPHLDIDQVSERSMCWKDFLLRERLTERDAQEMKNVLEASGVEVRMQPTSISP